MLSLSLSLSLLSLSLTRASKSREIIGRAGNRGSEFVSEYAFPVRDDVVIFNWDRAREENRAYAVPTHGCLISFWPVDELMVCICVCAFLD